jgi:hypothetical protein
MGQSPVTVATYCRRAWDSLRPAYDGPAQWLWFAGAARMAILFVVAAGTTLVRGGNALSNGCTRI